MVNNSTNINIVLFCFVYRNTIFTSIYFIIVTSRKMFWIILIFLTRNTPPTLARFLVWFMLLDLYFFVNCFVDHCLSFCPYFTWLLYGLSFVLISRGHCIVCLFVPISRGHCIVCLFVLISRGHCIVCLFVLISRGHCIVCLFVLISRGHCIVCLSLIYCFCSF